MFIENESGYSFSVLCLSFSLYSQKTAQKWRRTAWKGTNEEWVSRANFSLWSAFKNLTQNIEFLRIEIFNQRTDLPITCSTDIWTVHNLQNTQMLWIYCLYIWNIIAWKFSNITSYRILNILKYYITPYFEAHNRLDSKIIRFKITYIK